MENHPKWKGGRVKVSGYVYIRKDKRYRAEHRLVVEEHIGRELLSHEDVHHINGVKDDNRIDNLQLLTHKEHISIDNAQKGKRFWGKNVACTDNTDWTKYVVPKATPNKGVKKGKWQEKICLIESCLKSVKARNLCKYHYHSFLHFSKKYPESLA